MIESFAQILNEIFDVLGFSDSERHKAREDFKKKFYYELLLALEEKLPQGDRDWLKNNMESDSLDHQKVLEMQEKIKTVYSSEEIQEKGHEVFKKITNNYKEFMLSHLTSEKATKLSEVVASF